MRLRLLVALAALTVPTGCGAESPEPSTEPSVTAPSSTPTPAVSPAPTTTGRVAVDPEAQFVSYRRAGSAPFAADQALITGTLADADGCLVLEPGRRLVAFNADYATFDGDTLVLAPLTPGDPEVRVRLGETAQFGGGIGDTTEAFARPEVAVPRACRAVALPDIAYAETW